MLPGALGIGNGAGLHIQRLGRIQADIGGIGAVAAQEIPNLRPVEHLQLTVSRGVIAHPGNHRVVGGNHVLVRGGVGTLGGFVVGISIGGNGGGSLGFAYLGGLHRRGGAAIHAQENHRCQHSQQNGHAHNHQGNLGRAQFDLLVIIVSAGEAFGRGFRQARLIVLVFFHE